MAAPRMTIEFCCNTIQTQHGREVIAICDLPPRHRGRHRASGVIVLELFAARTPDSSPLAVHVDIEWDSAEPPCHT
jgi:hypothetical protein